MYSPFLIVFLLISCLLFFFELFYLPNGWLIWSLELLTTVWSWLISQGSSGWLIGFKKPSLWVLFIFPLTSFYILQHKKLSRPLVSSLCFLLILVGAASFLKFYPQPTIVIKQIPCNKGFVTIIKAHNTITVIDPGVMGQRVSNSWVEYTLIKELVQNFGTTTIDHCIVAKPGILTFDYCAQICRLAKVSSLYLVLWKGESEKRLLQNYGRLRHELEQKKGQLIRIKEFAPQAIALGKNSNLIIKPLETMLNYKDTIFPALQISLQSDELQEDLEVYSAYYEMPHAGRA